MRCLQGDFDVRWLRGSASELIFAPWSRAIQSAGGSILGGKRVSTIRFPKRAARAEDAGSSITASEGLDDADSAVLVETTDGEVLAADAVVLAVGITAAKVRQAGR